MAAACNFLFSSYASFSFFLLIPLLAESALERHEGEGVLVLNDDLG